MVETITVNATEENNPSLEEQSQQQDANSQSTSEAQTTETSSERPGWLPEKFANAEELAKAYGELEKRMSSKPQEPTKAEDLNIKTNEVAENKSGQLDKFYNEYADKGELSENSYTELANIGLSRDVVDNYISGQQALAEQKANSIMSTVGGREEYGAMIDWASKNLSSQEIKAFNNTIDNGSLEQAQLAIAGVQAKFNQNNAEPNLFSGTKADSNVGYRSVGEMLRDINDPRYSTDSAFRTDVENKVKLSNAL